jgi:hypothetical protein
MAFHPYGIITTEPFHWAGWEGRADSDIGKTSHLWMDIELICVHNMVTEGGYVYDSQ